MPAVSIPKLDDSDFEPDDSWKRQLKKRIEDSLDSMVKEVKDNQAAQLRKEVVTEETRMRLEEEYKQAMVNISNIATEQYRIELERERNQRRWTAGIPISSEWARIFAEEQQSIMNTIKHNQDTAFPTRPTVPLPSADSKEHRDIPRRASDARRDPQDNRSGSIRRKRRPTGSHPDDPESPDSPHHPEELRPPTRSRTSIPDPLPENNRWDSSLPRSGSVRSTSFSARSPPKSVPEVWKPTTPLDDDPSTVKSYHLGRRGSSASIKSTGSGTGVRPTISATIPERIDDADDSTFTDPSNYDHERPRKYTDKDRRGGRKNSRPTPVDVSSYPEDPLPSTPLKHTASPSVVMQLATSSGPIKSLSSKPSFVNGEERYYRDQHHSAREPSYRESPYTSRDTPLASRPVLSRSPYSPEDRDHGSPYSHRPPKTPFRDYPPQSSYSMDERRRERDWDIDRERDWDDDYGREREREREYEYRDREWDRDRDNYAESRHQYPARSATYPSPSSSVSRPPPHDHVNDVYDDREPPSRNYTSYRAHGSSSSPSDEWDYQRLDSSRPGPTRQPSYSRRDEPDRDQYGRPYNSSSSIPITPRHAPSSEDSSGPSWKDWGSRASESRYDGFTRSPPSTEPFPRRRPQYYHDEAPRNEGPPPVARRKSRPPHLADNRRDRDYRRDKEGDRSDDESSNQSESDGSEGNLEVETRQLEEERKETDRRIREKALEIKRLQEEEQRLEEEAKQKEEEVERKEEEVRRKDEEAKKVEQELQKLEEDAKRLAEEEQKKKDEARKREREMKKKEQEAKRRIEDANKLALEAGRKAEEARKKEDEINRKEEQTRKKEEKLKEDAERTRKLHQEANRMAEQARLQQETLRQMEEETKRKEQEIEERERALKTREDELKKREEEARRLREDARKLEEEAWRKEEEARRKETEARRKDQEARKREEEMRKREEARKREEDARRKEEERSREEKQRRESEMKRVDTERFFEDSGFENVDSKLMEEQTYLLQQAQYRKREEEIRRNREERKRQDSIGNDSAWTSSSTSSPGVAKSFPQFANSQMPPYTSPSPAPGPTANSAAWTTWGAPPSSKPSNITTPSNARPPPPPPPPPPPSAIPPLNKPRNGSISSGSHPTSGSPHSTAPISETEWARRHAEFTNDQQERFRREQERMEAERQLRAAGKPLSRDEIQRVFEHHDRLWSRLPTISELTWVDFPWPVLRPPSNPDDISFVLVNAYFSAPFLPERERSKSLKDRIKEHLRRWHPDRFDSKVLPRVVESEKDKVKLGAGNVVRYLNDLLRKENETGNAPSLFGE